MRRGIVSLLAVALVACGGGAAKKPEGKKAAPPPPPPPRSALTGLVAADPGVLKRCALAIKVENATTARPQSGLEKADVVYEEIAEGGITRFIALYQSQASADIGPVRSARLVDPNILMQFNAQLVYSGAHPVVKDVLRRSRVPLLEFNNYPRAFRRSAQRRAPHNLFTSTAALWTIAKCPPPPKGVLSFAEQPPALPSPVPPGSSPTASPSPSAVKKNAGVKIEFSESQTSIWRYDATKDAYLRWQGKERHLLVDGSQVTSRNVLLLYVQVKETNILDPAGNPSFDVVVTGNGKATLLRNGRKVSGRWSRPALEDRTALVDSVGNPMQLAPGITWVELVPVTSTASDL